MMFPIVHLTPLELLVNTLISRFLVSSYCITFFSEVSLTFSAPIGFTYIIPDEENLVQQILQVSEMGCSDYIISMKEPQKFILAFEKVIHLGNVRRSDRKIIILPYDVDENDANWAAKVFSMKETSFVANMLIVAKYKSDGECILFDLITHKFVGADEQVNELLYLDRWNSCTGKFENQVDLFPFDISNFYGKTLKVACFTYQPYVILDIDTALEPLGRDGIEIRIVDEFCRLVPIH